MSDANLQERVAYLEATCEQLVRLIARLENEIAHVRATAQRAETAAGSGHNPHAGW